MQPLRREVRAALKRAHPGLKDTDIDLAESLLVRRVQLDPERYPELIRQLDRERVELIKAKMPRYAEVLQVTRGQRAAGVPRPTIKRLEAPEVRGLARPPTPSTRPAASGPAKPPTSSPRSKAPSLSKAPPADARREAPRNPPQADGPRKRS